MTNLIPASEYCASIFDGTHDSPKPVSNGMGKLLITSKHILGGALDTSTAYMISENDYLSIQKRSAVSQWDILFSMIGSVGEIYLEKNEHIPYAIKNMGVFSSGDEKKARWLYYYLLSPAAKTHIQRYLNGAVQKFLPLGALRSFPVPIYDESKDSLVEILEIIDSKIQLNKSINAELEAMAKTLYDYWFVQFDFPDAKGKPYKTSAGKMVYNTNLKREIPEGWSANQVGRIEPNIITGKTPSTQNPDFFGGEIPFITIGDIRDNTFIFETEQTLSVEGANSQGNKYLPEGAICVTCIATPGLVGFVTQTSQTNQQINSIICSNIHNRYFMYFAINAYFSGAKAKTGNTFANMNKGDFSEILLVDPPENVRKLFHEKVDAIFEKIKVTQLENSQLVKLRDWLLPMLMNGQVKIK